MTETQITNQIPQVSVGERQSLSLPIELESGAPPHLVRLSMATVTGLIVVLLIWANIARVSEVAVAIGEIEPTEATREVAHLEGGIVDAIAVSPGATVSEGDTLIKLNFATDGGDYEQLRVRRANLIIEIERLTAQAENRAPDFSQFEDEWPSLVAEHEEIYEAEKVRKESSIAALQEQEAAARNQVDSANAQLLSAGEIRSVAEEQLRIQESLIDDGFTSRRAYLDAKSALATAQSRFADAKGQVEQAERALGSIIADKINTQADFLSTVIQERAESVLALAELDNPIETMRDRAARLVIRAPIAGTVKSVLVGGEGSVIRPGDVVAEITPNSDVLLAKVRLNPKDIGHIELGQETDITVTTFDPNRYGKLKGVVTHISADRFIDERSGEPYYVADVSIQQVSVENQNLLQMLRPGMQVRAEIVTHTRSFLEYLLKPVTRSLDNSFSERQQSPFIDVTTAHYISPLVYQFPTNFIELAKRRPTSVVFGRT